MRVIPFSEVLHTFKIQFDDMLAKSGIAVLFAWDDHSFQQIM